MFRAGRVGLRGRPGGRVQAPPPPAGRQEDLPPLPQVQAPVHLLPHLEPAAPIDNPPVGNYLGIEAAPQLEDQAENQDALEIVNQPAPQANAVGNYLGIEAAPQLEDQAENQDAQEIVNQPAPQANGPPVWIELEFQPYIPNHWSREARDEVLRLHNIATRLLNHLSRRYSNEAKELFSSRSFRLKIDFRRLKQENRQLAYDICNNYYEPQMQEFIGIAFRQFLLTELNLNAGDYANINALGEAINQHARISFPRMPRSIQSLSEFLDRIYPVWPYNLFQGCPDSVNVLDVDPQAHRYLRKAVQNVLNTHRKGFCWNGEWSLEDWEIVNDFHVIIDIDPEERVGRAGSENDLNRIAEELLPRFCAFWELEDEQIYPAYMQHLANELSADGNRHALIDATYFGWYYDFLMYHPALLPPRARKNFIYGIYDAMFKLQQKWMHPFYIVFGKGQAWTEFFQDRQHRILEAIYNYDPRPNDAAQPALAYYEDYVQDMLKLLRHVIEHAYDYALLQPNFTQSIRNGNECELFAAESFPYFFPELLMSILSEGCLVGEILVHWRIYVASFDAEV